MSVGYHYSRVEELGINVKILNIKSSRGFEHYSQFFPKEAIIHPARFNIFLIDYLVDNYTKPRDVILDPMAGVGTLGVVASLKGRNVIQVEVEPKFFNFMEEARRRVTELHTLTSKGWIVNILGDARELSKLVREKVDHVITSPPYAECKKARELSREDVEKLARRWEQFRKDTWNTWGKSAHTEGRLRAFFTLGGYPDNPNQIGLLKTGNLHKIDNIINNPSKTHNIEEIRSYLMEGGKPTYLSEMLRVYHEMYKVLKPKGLAIIVIKSFIRNWKPIDLPWYTYCLCRIVGFKLREVLKYRLTFKSFWRILHERKYRERGLEYPDILNYEYVLIFSKS